MPFKTYRYSSREHAKLVLKLRVKKKGKELLGKDTDEKQEEWEEGNHTQKMWPIIKSNGVKWASHHRWNSQAYRPWSTATGGSYQMKSQYGRSGFTI